MAEVAEDKKAVTGAERCAVVLTALPVEYDAVKAHLSNLKEDVLKQGTIFEVGEFQTSQGPWKVAVGQLVDPGNDEAAVETERAISHFKADVALFIGIAGSLKDAKLGDVVAATTVYGYEYGKEIDGGKFLPRGLVGSSTYRIIQRAKFESGRPDWTRRLGDTPGELTVHVKPIAAGSKVLASTEGEAYTFVRQQYSMCYAVEMEGLGFLKATRANPDVEALVVRGISDLIEGKNEGDEPARQHAAARNASAFAFEVLAKFGGPPAAGVETVEGQQSAGALPAVWNVPSQDRNFAGRKTQLRKLDRALNSGRPTALTQAISGLGGVGKTELAKEYVHRYGTNHQVVWWVRSEERARLASDFAALAAALDLPEKDAQDQQQAIDAVRRWLDHNGGWLLVFDNVPKPESVKDFLPQGQTGHVIITSRYKSWRKVAASLALDVMTDSEAVAFLLDRTGGRDRKGAKTVAKALGKLPLALAQAGAYVEETGVSFPAYLELLEKHRVEILARGTAFEGYDLTVATTWAPSFEAVEEESPAAAELLNLCAFFAPDDIPLDIIREGAEHLPPTLAAAANDDLAWNEAVAALRRYSLVEVRGDSLSVHRLVQAVARDRLEADQTTQLLGAAVDILFGAVDRPVQTDLASWPICARVLPHALASADNAEEHNTALGSCARLLDRLALYVQVRAQFSDAINMLQRALAMAEAEHGSDHAIIAGIVNNLGALLEGQGDLAGAWVHFERALRIAEAVDGPDHPHVATVLINLGAVLRAQRGLAEAREHFDRALRIDEAYYGPDHPEVAVDVNNLAALLQEQGDFAGSRKHLERALRIDEAAYGPKHPRVAIRLNNLGLLLKKEGDLTRAREHYERALRIDEAAYGPEHPTLAIRLNNLGTLLQEQGDLAGARVHLERALRIWEESLGPDHPTTTIARDNLAALPR